VEVGAHAGLAARHCTSCRSPTPRHLPSASRASSHLLAPRLLQPAGRFSCSLGGSTCKPPCGAGRSRRSHVFWLRPGDSAPESTIRGAPAGATPEAADGALPKGLEVL
jgi:hypothetical protein